MRRFWFKRKENVTNDVFNPINPDPMRWEYKYIIDLEDQFNDTWSKLEQLEEDIKHFPVAQIRIQYQLDILKTKTELLKGWHR